MSSPVEALLAAPPPALPDGAPETEVRVAPASGEELGRVLEYASERGLRVLVWGGGSHQGFGAAVDADLLLLTSRLDEIVVWEPEDLTVVVGAGTRVMDLERQLAERGQTAVLPESAGAATVGGVLAAGVSAWRRGRYGPTRDRILEVDLVTGDGRQVRAGGRVVKNVTGYDLPRLAVGSFGAIGVISQVCLKLWPLPEATATVVVSDVTTASTLAYRPLAVLGTSSRVEVFLGGTHAEVEAQVASLGGEARLGLDWPEAPPAGADSARWSLRIPPALLPEAISRIPAAWPYLAQHLVGEVELVDDEADVGKAGLLRDWAESRGGALVMVEAPAQLRAAMDPWGGPPPLLETQRRIVERFDPARVVNPGRFPGGI